MESFGWPAYLPEWRGAESATAASDMSMVRQRARELVGLVLAEDTRYLDALPETIESAIVTPLSILSHALDQGSDVDVLVASRLVRRSVEYLLTEAPPQLQYLVTGLPTSVPS
ncbi:hypothetical protein ACQP1P_33300 [Dactylosporangium sp. CA-052675]|uniref:hypothetical protein n=1 Tax=Dactylosporangium sp. CA-052675 TaxID=3239927 RepID=UPI003D8E945E